MERKTINISRLWHKKGKYEFLNLKQFELFFPEFYFNFYVTFDDENYIDEYTYRFHELKNVNIIEISKKDIFNFLFDNNLITEKQKIDLFNSCEKFKHLYHVLNAFICFKKFKINYTITHEYDVIFNNKDLTEIKNCLYNNTSFFIVEPLNSECDKSLLDKLKHILDDNTIERNVVGFNAGFQGINISFFHMFDNHENFQILLLLFDDNKQNFSHPMYFDTQEQSFFSIMNYKYSEEKKILTFPEYFVYPPWQDKDIFKKSKVLHYIGHTKIDELFEKLNEYENIL